MTNRDYAELMWSKKEEICDFMKTHCNNTYPYIKRRLEMKRNSKVERGQMRRNPYGGCFWVILYVSEENGMHDWCLGLDKHGNVARLSIDVVRTWLLWDNKFLERLLNDLINKQPWKEIE